MMFARLLRAQQQQPSLWLGQRTLHRCRAQSSLFSSVRRLSLGFEFRSNKNPPTQLYPSKPPTTPPTPASNQPLQRKHRSFTTKTSPEPSLPLHPRFAILMATNDDATAAQHIKKEFPAPPSIESLHERLKTLSINDPLPLFPDSNPTSNPVDVYRCFIAHHLAPITGVDVSLVYPALEWTQTLDKGDLIVAAPRLRVKGRKPDELAKEWAEKVCPRARTRAT